MLKKKNEKAIVVLGMSRDNNAPIQLQNFNLYLSKNISNLNLLQYFTPQHLHIVVDGKIKLNDWVLNYATTEKQPFQIDEKGLAFIQKNVHQLKKIIGSTDTDIKEVADIKYAFVEKFVESNNQNKPIREINVEYNLVEVRESENDFDENIYLNGIFEISCDYKDQEKIQEIVDNFSVPKLRDDGTLIIHKVQDIFTRKETIDAILEHYIQENDPSGTDHDKYREQITTWFNENF